MQRTEYESKGIALKSPVLRWRGKESMAGALRRAAMNGGGIDRKHGNGMGMQWDVKIARAWQGLDGKGAARALHRRVLQRARQGTDSQRRSKETLAMA